MQFRLLTLTLVLALLTSLTAVAQPDMSRRVTLNPDIAPYYHGVASGDPLQDRVIIWTRIAPDDTQPSLIQADWEVATDTLFTNVVANGSTNTTAAADWTIKIDVTGLSPDSWYYYRFISDGDTSMIGRTRTLPEGSVDNIRLGVASCQSYENGYYTAWEELTKRNDVDVVVFLGDYIYEYEGDTTEERGTLPENETVSTDDYRLRYNSYRLDPDLQYAHQQFPFINIWDDHEVTNNSYRDGAENHNPSEGEGDYNTRVDNALTAFYEWIPIREVDPTERKRIYRSFDFGDLLSLHMIETRLLERDAEGDDEAAYNDTTRRLIGDTQFEWLIDELKTDTGKWHIIGNQVMFSYLSAEVPLLGNVVLNSDQWDGYTFERNRIMDSIITNNIDNTVVLTGDIHTAWANDIPRDRDNYDGSTGAGSDMVEFVCTSITSSNAGVVGDFPVDPQTLIGGLLPHVKYAKLTGHGFYILDLKQDRAQADFYNVGSIAERKSDLSWDAGWYTDDGDNHLTEATEEAERLNPAAPLAPRPPEPPLPVVSRAEPVGPALTGAYPNPFMHTAELVFLNYEAGNVSLEIHDLSGRQVQRTAFGQLPQGLHTERVDVSGLAAGTYLFTLKTAAGQTSWRMVKR